MNCPLAKEKEDEGKSVTAGTLKPGTGVQKVQSVNVFVDMRCSRSEFPVAPKRLSP